MAVLLCCIQGFSPLLHAVEGNQIPLVGMLLDAGADINHTDPVKMFNRTLISCNSVLLSSVYSQDCFDAGSEASWSVGYAGLVAAAGS